MNKNESKYFNTAIKMDEALLKILEKKDFEYITVKEICEEAGVNRSTFYLHYANTCDLLNETVKYITDGFLTYFSTETKNLAHYYRICELKELVFVSPEYITPYLTYIKENQKIFKTSLKHIHSMGFDDVYSRMFRSIFNPILARFDFPETEREYVVKFYLTGITAVVMEWLKKDCSDSIETICRIITQCVFGKDNSK
ncbi:MAG: TetR/AcrR family transcriptional regulator [Clostridia bacterium]|nr:TetR/AcrR family transcriptional regulator [Clostridia bacterium]